MSPPFIKDGLKLKQFTVQELTSAPGIVTVIDSYVFDLTKFAELHPGGESVLKKFAGIDSSEAFFSLHKSEILTKYARLIIGEMIGEESTYIYPTPGQLSTVPNAEPPWLAGNFKSPYFRKDHRNLAMAMRKFVDEVVIPEARVHELTGKRPSQDIIKAMAVKNILAMRLGPGKHLHGLILPGGMKGEDYDYMAELVVTQELARMAARGYQDGLSAGMWIGLTPILNYGTEKQKELIPSILQGDKHICLAISEAFAGSDVVGLMTTAIKSKDGNNFIVNGTKKWITNSTWCDYATVAVQTDKGMSMLLIDLKKSVGVDTRAIATAYSAAAGTGYITFDDVVVPAENLIGELNQGLKIVLSNFNHERLVMVHFTVRQLRHVTENCFIWAHLRKVGGERLIDKPVIRAKFADMFAKCDAIQAQLEFVTYQMDQLDYKGQAEHLAGPIALLKTYATRLAHDFADHSVQIFGGRALTKGGMGAMIETFARGYKFDAILGGSEEVLADLGVRQAMKKMGKAVL